MRCKEHVPPDKKKRYPQNKVGILLILFDGNPPKYTPIKMTPQKNLNKTKQNKPFLSFPALVKFPEAQRR